MAIHSSTGARIILWTEEPGGLQSLGSQRVGQTELLNNITKDGDEETPREISGRVPGMGAPSL